MVDPKVPDDVRDFIQEVFATRPDLPRGTWEVSWSPFIDGPPAHIWAWHVVGEEEVN